MAEGGKVVDRPVEHEGEPAVRRTHRLVAVGRIENRQPTHPQRRPAAVLAARIIRSAMEHGIAHPVYGRCPGLRRGVGIDKAGDAAHAKKRVARLSGHGFAP